ncbi:hypothetical protein HDV00_008887, partial [Rhizophlyctis rosea]
MSSIREELTERFGEERMRPFDKVLKQHHQAEAKSNVHYLLTVFFRLFTDMDFKPRTIYDMLKESEGPTNTKPVFGGNTPTGNVYPELKRLTELEYIVRADEEPLRYRRPVPPSEDGFKGLSTNTTTDEKDHNTTPPHPPKPKTSHAQTRREPSRIRQGCSDIGPDGTPNGLPSATTEYNDSIRSNPTAPSVYFPLTSSPTPAHSILTKTPVPPIAGRITSASTNSNPKSISSSIKTVQLDLPALLKRALAEDAGVRKRARLMGPVMLEKVMMRPVVKEGLHWGLDRGFAAVQQEEQVLGDKLKLSDLKAELDRKDQELRQQRLSLQTVKAELVRK